MELVLFLPMLVALLLTLFTVVSYVRTRSEAAVLARHAAWSARDRPAHHADRLPVGPEATDVGRIPGGVQPPDSGLVPSEVTRRAVRFLASLNMSPRLTIRHCVLTDSWDHLTIPFADRGDHPRLVLEPRATVFGPIDRDVFAQLAGIGAAAGLAGQLNAARLNSVRQASRETSQAMRAVQNRIDDLQERARELENRIRELEAAEMPDADLIDAERNRLDNVRSEISELEEKLVELRRAERLL